MKNQTIAAVLTLALFFISASFVSKPAPITNAPLQDGIAFPENIQAIIDAKCMNCHKPDARNEKAREKLQWVKVAEMDKEAQADLVAELFEVLEEGKMPPSRTVERNPDMKLTDEETKAMLAWLEKEEKRLKGK